MRRDEYFGYIRVSDKKQEAAASLSEQRRVIGEYAKARSLVLGQWVVEVGSASKGGREKFTQMLRSLEAGKARGVIIHKIDRSARNMKDWGEISALLDSGVELYSASDNMDLQARGGRFVADVLAAVAADYSRNLKTEVAKGVSGRLHEGLWPFSAPLGYLDTGRGGKVKEVDLEREGKILRFFEEYAKATHTLESARELTKEIGLTTRAGGLLTKTMLQKLLRNPFYSGVMRCPKSGELFEGKHRAIVPASLFKRVQEVLDGRLKPAKCKNDFLFRRLLKCKHCGYALIGERQKGHVYYRCHTKGCPTTSVREEVVEERVLSALEAVRPSQEWKDKALTHLESSGAGKRAQRQQEKQGWKLKLKELEGKKDKLLDAMLSGVVDSESYLAKKNEIEDKLSHAREQLEAKAEQDSDADRVRRYLELAESLKDTWEQADRAKKRRIVCFATSNRLVSGRELELMPFQALQLLANPPCFEKCAHQGDETRTMIAQLTRRLMVREQSTLGGLDCAQGPDYSDAEVVPSQI